MDTTKLQASLAFKGLQLTKRNVPVNKGYSEEWVVKDIEGWSYAGLGVKEGKLEYTLVSNLALPFEAQTLIDWVQLQIVQYWRLP